MKYLIEFNAENVFDFYCSHGKALYEILKDCKDDGFHPNGLLCVEDAVISSEALLEYRAEVDCFVKEISATAKYLRHSLHDLICNRDKLNENYDLAFDAAEKHYRAAVVCTELYEEFQSFKSGESENSDICFLENLLERRLGSQIITLNRLYSQNPCIRDSALDTLAFSIGKLYNPITKSVRILTGEELQKETKKRQQQEQIRLKLKIAMIYYVCDRLVHLELDEI